MMREFQISVAPVEGGWSISCGRGLEPMLFLSGARAEAQARDLALRLSQTGDEVRVLVHDRDSLLVGSTRYAAADERRFAPA